MLASCTIAAAIACLAQDVQAPQEPAALARAFAQELGTHPYFSRVALERIESRPPYVFLVQKTGASEAERATVLAERYATSLEPALQLFLQEVAEPLGLARREDQRLVVAVLASPGDMENYQRVTRAAEHVQGQGLYDPSLNAAVLFEDPFHVMRSMVEQTLSARHAFLHVCTQAWFASGLDAPSRSWILEGLACELARRDPDAPLVPVAPSSEDLRRFLLDLQDEHLRWPTGRTLEELCTLSEPRNLADFFAQHAGSESPAPSDLAAAEHAFYRQSVLLLHFLLEGEERRHRAGALALLKQAFAGHADWPSCRQSLLPSSAGTLDGAVLDSASLDQAFLAWALETAQASHPRSGIDPAVVQKALQRGPNQAAAAAAPAPGAAPGSTPAAGAPPPLPAAPEPPTVPGLALDLAQASDEERLAIALYELGRGRAQAGLDALDGLLRATRDEGMRARAERERRRAAAWLELRDEFLRERLASKALLEFTYKGNKLKSQVLGYADGKLRLEKSRAPEYLSPDAIDPLELAQQIKASGAANDWVRFYPYVLKDDPRAKKLLKDEPGEAEALLADLRTDYPARLRLGALAGRIQELATRKAPTSAAEVRAQLDELAAWRREAEGSPLLERRRSALREHARALLLRELEQRHPRELLRGKLTARDGDLVRLVYEFEDPRELEDFSPEPYPVRSRKALGAENSPDVPFHVEQGGLVAQGQAALRGLLDLTAPLSVRYALEYREEEGGAPNRNCALGICDDGQEHFLWAINLVHLQRYDVKGNDHAHGTDEGVFAGTPYAMELRHDGSNVTLLCEAKQQQVLGVGSRQSGAVFVCVSSDCPVRIERLEIEGHLPANGLERLKRAWIERGMASF